MELLVTENRSKNISRFSYSVVRIFINRDYNYGYFIKENELFNLLTTEQQIQYLDDDSYSGGTFDIDIEIARKLIKVGSTPYNKQKL